MLFLLVSDILAKEVIINGEAFNYDWEYAPFTPFEAAVKLQDGSHNSAVFLYSDQQFQRVKMSVTVNCSQYVNVTLF